MKIILIILIIAIIFSAINYVETKPQKQHGLKNIRIINSYNIWNPSTMKDLIDFRCYKKYNSMQPTVQLNRGYLSMYIEWWGHNIGYYVTKPFCFIDSINRINWRLKDVDLNEWTN